MSEEAGQDFSGGKYAAIDATVIEIIDLVSEYMTGVSKERIRSEIMKAYIFARDAHE